MLKNSFTGKKYYSPIRKKTIREKKLIKLFHPFTAWFFNPFAIIEILSKSNNELSKNATTKLDIYKQFYK